jgi:hypothetical protein
MSKQQIGAFASRILGVLASGGPCGRREPGPGGHTASRKPVTRNNDRWSLFRIILEVRS